VNRERLLFAGVLGILALYFLVMREAPGVASTAKPGTLATKHKDVHPTPGRQFDPDLVRIFTPTSHVSRHPRVLLSEPEPRDLPDLWPPTSISVALWKRGVLRRDATAPVAGDPTITLPPLAGGENVRRDSSRQGDRKDSWTTFGKPKRSSGQVTAIFKGRQVFRMTRSDKLPAPPELPEAEKLLCMLEVDSDAASRAGITAVEVAFSTGGAVKMDFPEKIQNFEIADSGERAGWYAGARAFLKRSQTVMTANIDMGKRLVDAGVKINDVDQIRWGYEILKEARAKAEQKVHKQRALISMLRAANRLQQVDQVLALAFEHLATNPGAQEVWRKLGDMFDSRSFGLKPLAVRCYANARTADAQRRRVEVLLDLDRYEEAAALIAARSAGSGAAVDVLAARVALAQGTDEGFQKAKSLASSQAAGAFAAEANQILGGAAYAEGDAAEAERYFNAAVKADPGRSTAYSDLGLALAAQGKSADAAVCFERAYALDSIDNGVTPFLGQAFLLLNAKDTDGALKILDKLKDDNPKDLLVQYYVAYVTEQKGDLASAAKMYRAILDENHHYRFVIARLGLVQALRVLNDDASSEEELKTLAEQAVAHLSKSAALNPGDPVIRYILSRFLLRNMDRTHDRLAERLLEEAAKLSAPAGDPDLPHWIEASLARLVYRDGSKDVSLARGAFEEVQESVKRDSRFRGKRKEAEKHIAYVDATTCLDLIHQTENKVVQTWTFGSMPKLWRQSKRDPMQIVFRAKQDAAEFRGQVKMDRGFKTVLDYCSLEFSNRLTGKTFYTVTVEGQCKRDTGVDIGVGLVMKRRSGPAGIQVKSDSRENFPAVRIDGGESTLFKEVKATEFVPMRGIEWPADGKFTITISVLDRGKGHTQIHLNGQNIFEAGGLKSGTGAAMDYERCSLFGRGSRSGRPIKLVVWVEGRNGTDFEGVYLNKVTLTTGTAK